MKLPPIYVINLDRDVERWQRMQQVTRAADLPNVQRFSAINGKDMENDKFKEGTTWLGRQLQPVGVLGCAMSHMALWKKIVADKVPWAIILEDDVELVPNFREKLEHNLKQLLHNAPTLSRLPPSDKHAQTTIDVVLLGALGRVHPLGRDSLGSRLFSRLLGGCQTPLLTATPGAAGGSVSRPMRPAGTHAYLVSRRGAQKLLQACPKARFHIDIDAWGQEGVDVLMFNPMLAYQSFDSSTLIDQSPGDALKRNSLLRHLLRAEVGAALPSSWRDPFTRQPWRHALAEPLLQLPAVSSLWGVGGRGLVLRTDQCMAATSAGLVLAAISHLLRRPWLRTMLLKGALAFAALIRVLIALLLHSK